MLLKSMLLLLMAVLEAQVLPASRSSNFDVLDFLSSIHNGGSASRSSVSSGGSSSSRQTLDSQQRISKFNALKTSPFAFFRGTSSLWYRDWTNNHGFLNYGSEQSKIWIGGNSHIESFSTFRSPNTLVTNKNSNNNNLEYQLVYGLENYEEGSVGPYQLDVWRLATSLRLAAEALNMSTQADIWIDTFSRAYVNQLHKLVSGSSAGTNSDNNNKLKKKSVEMDLTASFFKGGLGDFMLNVEKQNSREDLLSRLTIIEKNKSTTGNNSKNHNDHKHNNDNNPNEQQHRKFAVSMDVERLDAPTLASLKEHFPAYIYTLTSSLRSPSSRPPGYFDFIDAVRCVSGDLSSSCSGKEHYYILIQGPSESVDDDVILDVRRGGLPGLRQFMTGQDLLQYRTWFPDALSEGPRFVAANRAGKKNADELLGYLLLPNHLKNGGSSDVINANEVFYVCELSPWKEVWDWQSRSTQQMTVMSRNWGTILAVQHSRSDIKFREGQYVDTSFADVFTALIEGDIKGFVNEVQQVAATYAKVVNKDYLSFSEAWPSREMYRASNLMMKKTNSVYVNEEEALAATFISASSAPSAASSQPTIHKVNRRSEGNKTGLVVIGSGFSFVVLIAIWTHFFPQTMVPVPSKDKNHKS